MQVSLLQLNQPLKLWEKLEIVVGEDSNAGWYLARIEDFLEEGIVISSPEFIEGGTLLRKNSHVAVFLTREDAVYRFYSRVKQVKTHLETIYLLTPPRGVKRIQRRHFVRIELYARVSYAKLTGDEKPKLSCDQITWRKSTTVDISGGGMLIKADENLAPRDLLLVKVDFFPEIGLPDTIAAICRRTFRQGNDSFVGIEFLLSQRLGHYFKKGELKNLPQSVRDFAPTAQNKLVVYIFHQQIELRKKGLL